MFEELLQPMHLVFILIIALIVFGPGKLTEFGAGLGKGIREFEKSLAEGEKEAASGGKAPGSSGTIDKA